MTFVQYDDFLEPAFADEIEKALRSPGFPWYFYGNVNYGTPPPEGYRSPTLIHDDSRFQDGFGFSHLLFPANEPGTPWYDHPKHILDVFLDKQGVRLQELLRMKANLLVHSPQPRGPLPFTPHVDLPSPHWALIYYVNDSDGDTIILNKAFPDRENPEVLHSVSPKKGRAILFDGRHYHCGTAPASHDTRIIINYDFL